MDLLRIDSKEYFLPIPEIICCPRECSLGLQHIISKINMSSKLFKLSTKELDNALNNN